MGKTGQTEKDRKDQYEWQLHRDHYPPKEDVLWQGSYLNEGDDEDDSAETLVGSDEHDS